MTPIRESRQRTAIMTMTHHAGRMIFALIAAAAAMAPGAYAQQNPYREDGWGKLPDGRKWGQTSAIDVDRSNNIWVFERCGANSCIGSNLAPLVKLSPSGRFLKNFGAGMFAFPHGIHIDRAGNVWLTDADGKDGKGHQVVKFSADGNGGDSNARIVKFSKDGKFIKTWGRKGADRGEFDTPHALAMDSRGRLFVGDRGNSRIQIFDQEGNFLEEWKQFGRPSGLFIDSNDILHVADHQSNAKLNPGFKRGIRIGSAKDGAVSAFIPGLGAEPETQSVGEGVAVDAIGNVYWAETAGMTVRKFVKK